jgi:Ca2+-binding EF-hand superfamily protein
MINKVDDVYECFAHNASDYDSDVNYMEFVTALIIYGEINWSSKCKFMFQLFDFDNSQTITINEMTMMGS